MHYFRQPRSSTLNQSLQAALGLKLLPIQSMGYNYAPKHNISPFHGVFAPATKLSNTAKCNEYNNLAYCSNDIIHFTLSPSDPIGFIQLRCVCSYNNTHVHTMPSTQRPLFVSVWIMCIGLVHWSILIHFMYCLVKHNKNSKM